MPTFQCQRVLCTIQTIKMKFGVIHRLYSNAVKRQTAGIIVIGNEILNGQVKDTNSNYISKLLYQCGIDVKKISVIEDNVDEITSEIKNFSEQFTHVVTSGGIGPTHDDVTFEGLAKAFGNSMCYNSVLVDIIKNRFGIKDPLSPAFKLAFIPQEASLKFGMNPDTGEQLSYPCVKLKNVYVFPGSPHFLQASFGNLYKKLFGANNNFVITELYINAKEEVFAEALTTVSNEFPSIKFGSYPQNNKSCYKARVTIVCDDSDEMERAKKRFENLIPPDILIDHNEILLKKAAAKCEKFVEDCKRYILYNNTLCMLRKFYENPRKVAIYFDGSLESIALLHLAHIIKMEMKNNNKLQILTVDFDTMKNAIQFIDEDMVKTYDFDLITLTETTITSALKSLIISKPNIKIVLFGIISEDNNMNELCKLMSNKTVELLNTQFPLIKWTYEDIQTFVALFSLPLNKQ